MTSDLHTPADPCYRVQARVEDAWHEVPLLASDPSALLINLGDLLQLWTRGTWHSPLHRVASTATTHTHLVSIVMFAGDGAFSLWDVSVRTIDN